MIHLSTQHKLCVLQRLIVEQPVQFRPLYRGVSVFVLHSGAVDGNGGATLEPGFHPVGIHIEVAGKQLVHGEPHFYIKRCLFGCPKPFCLRDGRGSNRAAAHRRNAAAAGRENVHHWFLRKSALGGQRPSTATPICASFCRRTGACRICSQPLFRISRNQGVTH